MKKNLTISLLLLVVHFTVAQKKTSSDYVKGQLSYTRLPLKPLDASIKTYTSVVKVIGGDIREEPSELAKEYLRMSNLEKVTENGDFNVKVTLKGYELNSRKVESRKERNRDGAEVIVYFNRLESLYPAKIEITNKDGKILFEESISGFSQVYVYEGPTMPSQSAAERYYEESNKELKRKAEAQVQSIVFEKIRNYLEDNFVKGAVKREVMIGFAEGKGHNFADINEAKSKILSAIADYNAENFSSANTKLDNAIEILNKALTETKLEEDKARISRRVAAMLDYNLALCHLLKNDFANAEEHISKSISTATNIKVGIFGYDDTIKQATVLKEFIEDQKRRFEVNNKQN